MSKVGVTLFSFIILLLSGVSSTWAQTEISGFVYDSETRETLPSATVQIKNTYRGTITNADGKFSIKIDEFPVTLRARFIGYEIAEITVNSKPDEPVSIMMEPSPVDLDEVVVSGEDPGMYIMRQVIAAKQNWIVNLDTYKADAYTRQILRNDTGIVSISESVSTAFWDSQRGSREIIKSKRQTRNLKSDQNWAGASYIPNMYDDNIEISGFSMVGITNPEAFEYYTYDLINTRKLGDQYVFDIKVIPLNELQPTFKGTISVLDNEFAILDVDLHPNESMIFPPPIKEFNLDYKQQFSNFGKDFWLPVDVRIKGDVKVGFPGFDVPQINFSQISRITDYEINVPVPDSLYNEGRRRLQVDSTSINVDSLFVKAPSVVPLDQKEEKAYMHLDSTKSVRDAFRPEGALADLALDDGEGGLRKYGEVFRYLKPSMWYDRVDGLSIGADLQYEFEFNDDQRDEIEITPGIRYTYKAASGRSGYGAFLLGEFDETETEFELRFQDESYTRFTSDNYFRWMNTVSAGMGIADYYDYYWARAWSFDIRQEIDPIDTELIAGWKLEDQRSTIKRTDYDLLGRATYRLNPAIDAGRLHAFSLGFNIGDRKVPLGAVGRDRIGFLWTHSNTDLGSDFQFNRLQGDIEFRLETFLQRRFLPNALDVKLTGAHTFGDLPIQQLNHIDGSLMAFMPFGTMKTLRNRAYEGRTTLGMFWEHNFRTVPFELIGLTSVAKDGTGLIIFGGHARSWMPDNLKQRFNSYGYANYSDGFHHEIGVSINSLFGILRIDFAKRIDAPGFFAGISLARVL